MEASALQQAVAPRVARVGPRLLRLRSNDQLVSLFRSGDDDAFRVIHDRYRGPLLSYARHVLGASQAEAEDVLQDVFVRAYRGLRAHDRRLNLSPWLYRVARNACIDELRRRVPVPHEEASLTERAPDEDPVHAALIQRERVSSLLSDLQQLPEQQRSALLLCELIGMSYADVAATLETTVSAVKSLLVRARLGLALSLEARETACSEIRDELADAHARGEKPNALARRHVHECQGCRRYSVAMSDRRRALAALTPTVGPVAVLAKLFGYGGAGSGATAGAAAAGGAGGASAASGGLAVSAGVIGANAAHVLTVLAATTIVAASAIGIKEATTTHTPARPSTPVLPSYVPPSTQSATAAAARFSRPGAETAAAAIRRATAGAPESAISNGGTSTSRTGSATNTAGGYTPPVTPAPSGASTKSSSSSSSCPIGQQSCASGATGASTGYSGPTATNTGATSSQLPLGSGGSSTSTAKIPQSSTPIGGGDSGSSSATTPPASNSTSSSSSQPLGSSSSPPLGS